ncbi:uncharacterized protein LOC132268271 isoform X2 [Cornus florida]|uniref:uncharacterized protein LOC132268271 isoform X2 n=1 Tax=Cornus florida TaxID=4283 RepID=UPI0028993CFF|nr:uncharacterized protein LOC132268271 isoform X2 [Cornus florida]
MSRICVKNLPKYAAEDRLREFFSQKGEVTDAKLMRTKDGKSRQFGFIGYRTEHEAEEALKYFNNSYFDTFRITCEIAHKVGDPNIPRPWSRHSLKKQEKSTEEGKKVTGPKSLGLPNSKGEKKDSKNINENTDPQLQEFLQVMQPRIKSKLWANDSLTAPPLEQKGKLERGDGKEESTLVQAELDETDERDDGSSDGEAAERPHNLAHDEVISDMDYFKSRVKKEWSDSESGDDENDNDEDDDDNNHGGNNSLQKSHGAQDVHKIDPKGQNDSLEGDASEEEVEKGSSQEFDDEMIELDNPSPSSKDGRGNVLETARLFVRNLPYTATEDELEEHFSKYGQVSQVHLVIDRDTKRSKGIAYVLYALPESAARALEELDNSIFQGRLLHIMPAKQKSAPEKQEINFSVNQSSKTLKQQREEEEKKSEASGNTQAWNSLFMRPDTVVENIARKFGASKSDLLDREADDLAVRIALGETQVIAETKKALVNAGVNISSLEEYTAGKTEGVKRSNHVILVKNLPYGSSEGELAKMFGKFGSLDKIILPPTKTLALVVFLEPTEARAAFRGLAYKRYKDAPLYLEWAPGNILSQNSTSVGDANNCIIVGENDAKRVLLEQHVEGIADADIDTDKVEGVAMEDKSEELASLLKILPPVEFCCVYGSALHPNNCDKSSMVDYILGVADPLQWHAENLKMNRDHYASWMVHLGGARLITDVADEIGVGVHFNPFVTRNNKMFKYGVVRMDDLIRDILNWERFYLSGRLQKPVHILKDNLDISNVNSVNLRAATSAALLLLPSKFNEEDLFAKICSLSYMGDLRMLFAEDKNKVKNIVQGQFGLFQTMYKPYLEEHATNDLLRFSSSGGHQVNISQVKLYAKL